MSTVTSSNPSDVSKLDAVSSSGQAGTALEQRDSTLLERVFDPASQRDWCELVRDVAAIANSGGGQIVLRDSAGDSATTRDGILQRLAEVTDSTFADIHVRAEEGAHNRALVVTVGGAAFLIVFTKAGSYLNAADPANRVEVFAAGSVYFWNGEKAEPATSRGLQSFVERVVRRVRRSWLVGIRRIMNQPVASLVGTKKGRRATRRTTAASANLQPVRIVTDPDAPALQPQEVDRLYPLRQKDLVAELNRRLGRRAVNSYDIQAVRRHHQLDERPDFVFHLLGAGRRYSSAMLEWIMNQHERDAEFFRKARAADQELLRLRRQKPR